MRAIARILLAMGHRVSGSDRADSEHVQALRSLGATVFVGHEPEHIRGAELLTKSTAVPATNPEVVAADAAGIPVHSRAEMLAALTALRPGILVAGTHGKTTTSSMLAVVLDEAQFAPSFLIGSDVAEFGTGARWESGEHLPSHFVVEADESDGTFLALPAAHAIVTSLDPDHLEFYGTPTRLQGAFRSFVDGVPGTTAVCTDDPDTEPLLDGVGVVTYGTLPQATFRIADIVIERQATSFDAFWHGTALGRLRVGLPGHHNALNAAGAAAIALTLGVPVEMLRAGLARFRGVARRYEQRGEQRGTTFVDDYAHLPAEVEAAVATATAGPWNRVIAAYQPHRFSRTEALGATFATSFRGVDHLVLTDIYPSGEMARPGVTGRIVFDAVVRACPELSVSWQPTLADVTAHLAATVGPGDLCLTLGAGDLTTVPDQVLALLNPLARDLDVGWLQEMQPELRDSTVTLHAPLGPLTTYRVGGAALALVEVGSVTDLEQVVAQAIAHQIPMLPLGKGSNMLVADRGFGGIALVLNDEFERIEITGTTVRLGAGVALPSAARRLAQQGLRGFEWAVGVPGTVGGAVAMNAGGHGSDMHASVVFATIMDLQTGLVSERSAEELRFGYRTSSVAASDLVLQATLELAGGAQDEAEAVLSEIVRWRRANQPGGQNAGSVFTNPANDSAGRLIDASGGKGRRIGSAEVSTKHANFIQADPGGSADDIRALMHSVRTLVEQSTGVTLHPETRLVGFLADGVRDE